MPQWEYCTLVHNSETIYYTLYQPQGEYSDTRPYTGHLWAGCIAVLGSIRWEAITISLLLDGQTEVWYFKRPTQPGNGDFVFQ